MLHIFLYICVCVCVDTVYSLHSKKAGHSVIIIIVMDYEVSHKPFLVKHTRGKAVAVHPTSCDSCLCTSATVQSLT